MQCVKPNQQTPKTLVFCDALAQKSHKTRSAGSSFLMNNQNESINQQGTVQILISKYQSKYQLDIG